MTSDWTPREQPALPFAGAIGIALLFLLLLFASIEVVEPSDQTILASRLKPPTTTYYAQTASKSSATKFDARATWTPVLFARPTKMGFSRELNNKNQSVQPTQSQDITAEQFLDAPLPALNTDLSIDIASMLLVGKTYHGPALPVQTQKEASLSPRRINIDPALLSQLEGGIILPPSLNKPSVQPWKIEANICISPVGQVSHAFLTEPHESSEINGEALTLLYNLRFKPGQQYRNHSIEIFSPKAPIEVEP